MLAVVGHVMAQRPLIPVGSPEYLFMPPPGEDSVSIYYSADPNIMGNGAPLDFAGTAYRQTHDTWVYGVALATRDLERYPYYWVYLMQERLVDSVNLCYAIDTMVADLYCFIERAPVSYADFAFGASGSVIVPCYEFYFADPVLVPAGTRFYVGISYSPYNVYNHVVKDHPYNHMLFYHHILFISRKPGPIPQDPYCSGGHDFDGLDSTWHLRRNWFPGLVDWRCDRCHTPTGMLDYQVYRKYMAYGFFPIVQPPTDSSRIFPRHEHPLKAAAVENFRLAELDSAHATFVWDTFAPSDWGLVGVNVDAYEVNWAPYTEEYSETDTLMTTDGSCTLYMDFDTTVMYKVRCRGRSHHYCDIHSMEVWGDWSEEVLFHTGVGVPDTVLLDKMCRRVEGLRYEGLYGGYPKFAWERCEWQTRFEVQYAPMGSSSWRSAATTSMTNITLLQDLDPVRHYWLRVRALCDHHCHIHDTLLMGEWSDTLEFCLTPEGVDEADQSVSQGLFVVAPNPTSGMVTVTPMAEGGEYPAVLTVNDAKGNEVLRRTLADGSPQTLDLSRLPSGSYLFTLTTRSRRTETQRLMLE